MDLHQVHWWPKMGEQSMHWRAGHWRRISTGWRNGLTEASWGSTKGWKPSGALIYKLQWMQPLPFTGQPHMLALCLQPAWLHREGYATPRMYEDKWLLFSTTVKEPNIQPVSPMSLAYGEVCREVPSWPEFESRGLMLLISVTARFHSSAPLNVCIQILKVIHKFKGNV